MFSSIEDTFVVLSLLKKRKIKYWAHPILKHRGRSSPSLSRSSGIITGDSKLTSGCQWLSFMLYWRCEPHIKKTTNFSELSVQGYTMLCAAIWSGWTWQSPFWILSFACTVALNCQNTSHNACYGCKKLKKKNQTDSKKCYDKFFLWGSMCNDL